MTKFNIVEYTAWFSEKDKINIEPGCAYEIDEDPIILASFDSLDEAKTDLNKRESNIHKCEIWCKSHEYLVTEYGISEDYYDDDGEWQDHNEIWGFSKFKINIIAGYNDEVVMQCGDMKSARHALLAYEDAWFDSYLELHNSWIYTWDGNVKVVNSVGDVMKLKDIVPAMDNKLKEELYMKLPQYLDQEFFNEYCCAHERKFGEKFILE